MEQICFITSDFQYTYQTLLCCPLYKRFFKPSFQAFPHHLHSRWFSLQQKMVTTCCIVTIDFIILLSSSETYYFNVIVAYNILFWSVFNFTTWILACQSIFENFSLTSGLQCHIGFFCLAAAFIGNLDGVPRLVSVEDFLHLQHGIHILAVNGQ